ncbi:putative WD40/YVTN repeat-like domain, LisH dimerization motif protein, partial [Pseudoloma neurophilia]
MADNQDTTRTTLNILIYEYLSKNNYSETADVFKREAQVEEHAQTDSGPVLLTWFEMFDDICKIRSGKSKAFDTLTRVEAIMVKLENDKTRCNKHLITRQHNVNREREISDHVGQINTSQLNFSMPNNYNQNIRRDSLNNNIKMMVNKNTAQLRKTPRMTQLSHPQIQQFRHLPNSMQPTTMEIPYPDQQYHYRQSPNYPIHPNFSGQHIQTPNHDMTFNQDMAQKYGSDGRYFFTEKDAPERKRVSDTIDYSDGKKYGQSNDFSDGKKY